MIKIPTCEHALGVYISPHMQALVSKMEKMLSHGMIITSGVRCEKCNASVGGARNSAHLRGLAVDIKAQTGLEKYEIVATAITLGVRRIGIYEDHVHIDIDDSLLQNMMWIGTKTKI